MRYMWKKNRDEVERPNTSTMMKQKVMLNLSAVGMSTEPVYRETRKTQKHGC